MKQPSLESCLVIGLVLVVIFSTIPFKQVVVETKAVEHTSLDQNRIEIMYGGPEITLVKVICNRTAEIRFMYLSGVWISTTSILLASFRATAASYDYNAEHVTTVVEVISDGPILVRIEYTYSFEIEASLFDRFFYALGMYY